MSTSIQSTRTGSPRRRILLVILATTILFAIAGALFVRTRLDVGTPIVGATEVAVQDELFAPAAVEVPAGTTITWQWEGEEEHNVVGETFESPTQVEGTFTHTFAEPGTYSYECTLHFFMRGEVVVTD